MNRRDFLRNAAIASTATAVACDKLVYDPKTPLEHVLPYATQEDDVLPGTAVYYATTCTGCASACGTLARVKDGRAIQVAGNPDQPSSGALCVRGHMGLLEAYSPDRFAGPMNGGKATTWDEALAAVQGAITQARTDGKVVAWLGQYRTGSLARLLDELAAGIGLRRVHWEPLGAESQLAASRAVFGKDALPRYELADAHAVVSFGMDFLGTALDTLHLAKGWSMARDPAHGGFVARYVAIEPRVGVTSTQADNFLAPAPGTEAVVAMAIARLVRDAAHYSGPAAALVEAVDVAAAASASGIAQEKLQQVATWITEAPSVVLPGGHANASADATTLAIATLLINEYAGNIGRSVTFGNELNPGTVSSYADVKALLDDARAGNVGVLFVDGVNPVYNLPAVDKAAEALAAVGTLIHFTTESNDSLTDKSIVLTTGSGLEEWGDASFVAGVAALQQPAMLPLHDSRSIGDVLLAIGKALVPAEVPAPADAAAPEGVVPAPAPARIGFAAADFGAYVKARWQAEIFPASGELNFEAFWTASQQRGGFYQVVPATGASVVLAAAPTPTGVAAGSDPILVVFASNSLGDGRHANRPWAQEIPDPVTTYNWSTWAEINPATAEKLGLGGEDMVTVKTEHGSIDVGYFASPGVPENTIAVILGNGHKGAGRYANGRGANPMAVLGSATDTAGALAYLSTRATVTRTTGQSGLLTFSGNMNQDGRPIANTVTAADAVAHLEGEAGSIVHLHEIPVDARLTEAGITDMFPEPQHPTYRFAMAIDTNACNGCGACTIACNIENNIPFVGPSQSTRGRMMSWIRMNRFWEGSGEHQDVRHMPSLCQHCAHAPCEGVCPVLATYHNLDGLNAMIYNRCVGTRYCANNCPYTARRFNYHSFEWPESMHLMLNPDVTTREMGVMEKCTFCIQRIRDVKDAWRDVKETVPDAALVRLTACAAACPTHAITFGNAKDAEGAVAKKFENPRSYTLLGELNTKPGIRYMARVRFTEGAATAGHGGGAEHGGGEHGGETKPAHAEG